MNEEIIENKNELLELLLHGNDEDIQTIMHSVHPADILDLIHTVEDDIDIKLILERLPDELIADILEQEDDEEKYPLLQLFDDDKQMHIMEEMSRDELTDLVGELDEEEADAVLENMSEEDRQDIEKLLTYDPETAGGIMSTEFIRIKANDTVEDTLRYLQQNTEEDTTYYLYVVDNGGYLKGVVSLRDIVSSTFDTKIIDITNPKIRSVLYDQDQEEVAHMFEKYGFVMMPVVDENNKILGVISFDDIMYIIQEENTEDIHHLGGVGSEERVDSSWIESSKSRLPWLLVNLITAILASLVVSIFEGTISQIVALAAVMPIVTGMGGNAGTQTLTIVVRGLSLGELTKENAKEILLKEIITGIVSGIVIGICVSLIALYFENNPVFGLITGLAMLMNMILANISGYFIPVILEKFKIDPALASGVFVTTVTDVMGFFLFLGFATIALPYIL